MTVNSIFDGFNIDFVTGNCKLHYSLGINLFNGYRLFYTIIKDLDAIVCLLWIWQNPNLLLELIISTKKNTPSKQDIHAHLTTSADHIFICLWLKWRNDEGKSYALSINGWTRSNLTYKVINALFCLWIIWLFCSAPFAGRLPIWVCVCGVHHKRNSNDCKFKFSTKWSQCAKDSWQWTQKKHTKTYVHACVEVIHSVLVHKLHLLTLKMQLIKEPR